jgi:hypothetical protein
MFRARNIHYELSDQARGLSAGGIGAMHLLARRTGLIEGIDESRRAGTGPTSPASKRSRGDDETNTTECPQVDRRTGQRGETLSPTFRENRAHGVQGDSLVLGLDCDGDRPFRRWRAGG